MNQADFEKLLDDYVDGLLPEKSRRAVENHLEANPKDRWRLEEIRLLKQGARELPKEMELPRNLWPGIRAQLSTKSSTPSPSSAPRWKGLRAVWLPLAASLVVLFAGALTLDYFRMDEAMTPQPARLTTINPTNAELARIGMQDAELEYIKATDQLLAALEKRRDQFSPETLKILDENLIIINKAIEEVQDALKDDPENLLSRHTLTAMYRQKVQMLWKASRISPEL